MPPDRGPCQQHYFDHQFECVIRCGVDGGGSEGGGPPRRSDEEGGGFEVRVTCVGKKDGQLTAAQAMLRVRHSS